MPVRLGRLGRHAIAFFADRADQHRHALGNLGSGLVERAHRDHAAIEGWPIPTRGVDPAGAPIPRVRGAGPLILAAAAFAAAFSLDHSIFCSEARSFDARPSSVIISLDNSLDCSALGGLPPPPDCTEARWNSPAAEGIPIRQVTLEPPPDWP